MILFCCYLSTLFSAEQNWKYLENEHLKVGVDLSRGACIGYFSEVARPRNLLNHYDEGRFLQQSYYGKKDGSRWEGRKMDWIYNPVQGGSWDGKASTVLNHLDKKGEMMTKITPLHWATGELLKECQMTQRIELIDDVARLEFQFEYQGETQDVLRDQECPALFVDADLKYLCYTKDGEFIQKVPGLLSEDKIKKDDKSHLRYDKSDSEWVAFVDEKDWGIGLYTPDTTRFTCYRAEGDGKAGPEGSACSYVSPLKTFKLTKSLKFKYHIYLMIGSLSEIKERFEKLKELEG